MADALTAAKVQHIKTEISISVISLHQHGIRMRTIKLQEYCITACCVFACMRKVHVCVLYVLCVCVVCVVCVRCMCYVCVHLRIVCVCLWACMCVHALCMCICVYMCVV